MIFSHFRILDARIVESHAFADSVTVDTGITVHREAVSGRERTGSERIGLEANLHHIRFLKHMVQIAAGHSDLFYRGIQISGQQTASRRGSACPVAPVSGFPAPRAFGTGVKEVQQNTGLAVHLKCPTLCRYCDPTDQQQKGEKQSDFLNHTTHRIFSFSYKSGLLYHTNARINIFIREYGA